MLKKKYDNLKFGSKLQTEILFSGHDFSNNTRTDGNVEKQIPTPQLDITF